VAGVLSVSPKFPLAFQPILVPTWSFISTTQGSYDYT